MDSDKLRRFFRGECSEEEVHQILRWINSPDGKKELGQYFDEFGDDVSLEPDFSHAVFDRVSRRIGEGTVPTGSENAETARPKSGRKPRPWFFAAAATLTLLLLAFWSLHFNSSKQNSPMAIATTEVQWVERSVPVGQKLRLKLGDGSEVLLNSKGSIRFPKVFPGGMREVWLDGEAFFQVTHDPTRPFVVHSGNVQTRVLGTSFVVSRQGRGRTTIGVLTGKVRVATTGSRNADSVGVDLLPMDAVEVNPENDTFRQFSISYDDMFAWKDDVIAFSDADFSHVVRRLEDWYGVRFRVDSDWNPKDRYTGRFEKQTLEEVLTGLSFVYDFRFRMEGDTVDIY